jgi:hypothetical protein
MTSLTSGGAILLVAGRVDHRGEEVSILADLVVDWEAAVTRGPEAFARDVAAGDRGGGRRRASNGGSGQVPVSGRPSQPPWRVGAVRAAARDGAPESPSTGQPGLSVPPAPDRAQRRVIMRVSPLRAAARPAEADELGILPDLPNEGGADTGPGALDRLPPIAPAEPIPTYREPPGLEAAAFDGGDEPPLPDEVRQRVAEDATASTAPTDAGIGHVLHVRFSTVAGTDRVVGAMEAFRAVLRDRPGGTRVVIHLPSGSGVGALPMELRTGVAYDTELLAEVQRRLGQGIVELQLR